MSPNPRVAHPHLSPEDTVNEELPHQLLGLAKQLGATFAAWLVERTGGWEVVASAGRPLLGPLPAPLSALPVLPAEVIRRAARTRQDQVSGNAVADVRFRSDPCVALRELRSLLAVPLMLRSEACAVLYVEDSYRCSAFSWSRVLEAKRAAVALGNIVDRAAGHETGEAQAQLTTPSRFPRPHRPHEASTLSLARALARQVKDEIEPLREHLSVIRAAPIEGRLAEDLARLDQMARRLAQASFRLDALAREEPDAPRLTTSSMVVRTAAHSLQAEHAPRVQVLLGTLECHLVRVDQRALVDAVIELGHLALAVPRLEIGRPCLRLSCQVHTLETPADHNVPWLAILLETQGAASDASVETLSRGFAADAPPTRHEGPGLAYVRAVATQHGGHVETDVDDDRTFARIWLPLDIRSVDRSTEQPPPVPPSGQLMLVTSPAAETISFDSREIAESEPAR